MELSGGIHVKDGPCFAKSIVVVRVGRVAGVFSGSILNRLPSCFCSGTKVKGGGGGGGSGKSLVAAGVCGRLFRRGRVRRKQRGSDLMNGAVLMQGSR